MEWRNHKQTTRPSRFDSEDLFVIDIYKEPLLHTARAATHFCFAAAAAAAVTDADATAASVATSAAAPVASCAPSAPLLTQLK